MNVKKCLSVFSAVLLGVVLSAQAVELSAALKTGLIGYYSFDGVLADACGLQKDCVQGTAAYTADRNGVQGHALTTGATSNARIPNSSSLAAMTGSFTVSCWARVDAYSNVWAIMMCKGADYPRQYCIGWNTWKEFMFEDSSNYCDGGASVHVQMKSMPPTGTWFHLTVVHSSRTVQIYLNGTLNSYPATYYGELQSNDDDIYLGSDPPGEDERYEGAIDEVAFWNRALDAAEVAALYNAYSSAAPDPEPEPESSPEGFKAGDPYYVIDLSAGQAAESYPVASLAAPPEGGWSDLYKTSWLVLRRIEPGTYTMGDQVHGGTNYPNVKLTKPYYVGLFEVTQRQWELVMGSRPSFCQTDYAMRPVENVTYNMIRGADKGSLWPASGDVDETSFLGVLRAKTGLNLDLPTEAQWQFACRAGTATDYNNGTDYENAVIDDNMAVVGRYQGNSRIHEGARPWFDTTRNSAVVGSYVPNAWGLYDMHGNVSEWCLDWMGDLSGETTDPAGAAAGTVRVRCGGSWGDDACNTTSASRAGSTPFDVNSGIGFRLAVEVQASPDPEPAPTDDLAAVYGPYIPGVPLTLELKSQAGWKASGLPPGLKFDVKTGTLSGTPTGPGAYAVRFKQVQGRTVNVANTTVTIAPLRKVVVTVAAGMGSVKGAGVAAANAVMMLTAKPGKGYAAAGWYCGEDCLSREAVLAYVVGTEETQSLTVKFVPVADDASSIVCSFAGTALSASEAAICVTNYQGVAAQWPIAFGAVTQPKLKATGLPAGLVLRDGLVSGVPKVASKIDRKTGEALPTTATLTVTTLAGNTVKYPVRFVVLARGAWAVGTYTGAWLVEDEVSGMATFALAANGKGSGRLAYVKDGKAATMALTSTALAAYDATTGEAALDVTIKGSGIETWTVRLALRNKDGLGLIELLDGEAEALYLNQDVWKRTDVTLPVFPTGRSALTLTTVDGVTLTFGAKGHVKFACKVAGDDGTPVSVNGSALVQASWNAAMGVNAEVLVFASAKKNLSKGYAKLVQLHVTTDAVGRVESVEEVAGYQTDVRN